MTSKVLRFEITDKCNQKCNMCWSTDWKHCDMSWENIKQTILDYANHFPDGIIVLTSREPLLSSNFEKVLKLSNELGLKIKLLTNGTLFNDYNCDMITKSNIDFISISLHGNSIVHNKIVGMKNSYQKILEGLKKINEYKQKNNRNDLCIRITTVINEQLFDNIDDIIEVAKKYNTELRIQHMMWHNDEIKNNHKKKILERFNYSDNIIDGFLSSINIDAEYVITLLSYVKKRCEELNIDLQIYPYLDYEQIKKWYSNDMFIKENIYCDHVDSSIRMRANGDITLCQYIEKKFGNVTNNKIEDIINDKNYIKICNELKNGQLFPICSHCCHVRVKKNRIIGENKKI